MDLSAGQMIAWIIIGGLGGAVAGMIVKRSRRGFGLIGNIIIGLVGALLGGFLFNLFGIDIAGDLQITANDLIAAIVGSLILVGILTFVRR